MSWKLERDTLIAQTLAFVQSVTGKREETGRSEAVFARPSELDRPESQFAAEPRPVESPKTVAPKTSAPKTTETIQTPLRAPSAVPAPPGSFTPGDMVAEIRARVASFRAHQERFNREREEYFAKTLANLKAAIKDGAPPQPRD